MAEDKNLNEREEELKALIGQFKHANIEDLEKFYNNVGALNTLISHLIYLLFPNPDEKSFVDKFGFGA